MAIKQTINRMHDLIDSLSYDLSKAEKGNKSASQRFRTGSIQFQKIAKLYRKESIDCEKKMGDKKSHQSTRPQPRRKSR